MQAAPPDRPAVLPAPRDGAAWTPRPRSAFVVPDAPDALGAWAAVAPDALLVVSGTSGRSAVTFANAAAEVLSGYAAQDLLGHPPSRLLDGPEAELLDPLRASEHRLVLTRHDGTPLPVVAESWPVGAGSGTWVLRLTRPLGVEGMTEALRRSHERFQALADRAPIAIFCSDVGLRLGYVNDRFATLLGRSAEHLLGTSWLSHVRPEDLDAFTAVLTAALQGTAGELPLRLSDGRGQERLVQARVEPVASGGQHAFVGTFEDVTEREALQHQLQHAATHDPLTGLLNRRGLLEHLGRAMGRRRTDARPALLFLDLDDFKHVNDTYGHDVGDALLSEVARRLAGALREGDVVSRFGGDEFAVLCTGVESEEHAAALARRVLAAVRPDVRLEPAVVRVQASLGVVVVESTHLEAQDVLRDADLAMYSAKAAGKDGFAVFDAAARALADRRLELVHDLRRSLDAEGPQLAYQPVVEVHDGATAPRTAGVEALVRWSSSGVPVPPDELVPLAEEHGLVHRLGESVLRSACAQLVAWQADLGAAAPSYVAVNVSALQLGRADFVAGVTAALAETGLPPAALCLEITESAAMRDVAAATAALGALRATGVRVSLDDFGTGHSSLSLLRHLPIDQVKIDRSFLREAADPVVAVVVALGRTLGLDVVAEGVETRAQLDELVRLGCPHAQGWLFGRPLPGDELAEVLRRGPA